MLVSKLFSSSALLLGLSATNVLANMKCGGSDPKKGTEIFTCSDGNFLTWSAADCANACSCVNGQISCEKPSDCAFELSGSLNDYCASGMKDDWTCDCSNQKRDTRPPFTSPFMHNTTRITSSPTATVDGLGPDSVGPPTTFATSTVSRNPGQSPNKPPNPIVPGVTDCDKAGMTCNPDKPENCCSCQCVYGWTIGYVCGGGVYCHTDSSDGIEARTVDEHKSTQSTMDHTESHPHTTKTHPHTTTTEGSKHTIESHVHHGHHGNHTHTGSHTGIPITTPTHKHTTGLGHPPPPPSGLPPYNPSAPAHSHKNGTHPGHHHTKTTSSSAVSTNPAAMFENKRDCNPDADGCSACTECCVFKVNEVGCNQPFLGEIVQKADGQCRPVPVSGGIPMYSFTMTECTGWFDTCYLYKDPNCQETEGAKVVDNKTGQCIDYFPSAFASIKCFGGDAKEVGS